ncbi:MAG TPA: hypothetical protein VHZ26_08255 [Caulobacteraceae bacterium]|nr:hypothetical protein [Caulobacteraceae bacterium]
MSVERDVERARQIAALRHPLTYRGAFTPISHRVTDSLKDPLDAPRTTPFDRVGVFCLAWSSVFIVLTTVLALTLK